MQRIVCSVLGAWLITVFGAVLPASVHAEKVGCVSTTWRVINNDKVCVEAFKDPLVEGVVCHVSYAQTGGISGALGFAEDPSRFSIACRQVGPLVSSKPLPKVQEGVFTQRLSFLFKGLNVSRIVDVANHTLVYLVISEKIIDGSPFNSVSSVPLMPWGTIEPNVTVK